MEAERKPRNSRPVEVRSVADRAYRVYIAFPEALVINENVIGVMNEQG